MTNCMTCKHLKCEAGDRWTPTQYWCDMGMDEEECEEYCEAELVNEEWERHDAQLRMWDKDER